MLYRSSVMIGFICKGAVSAGGPLQEFNSERNFSRDGLGNGLSEYPRFGEVEIPARHNHVPRFHRSRSFSECVHESVIAKYVDDARKSPRNIADAGQRIA